MVCINAVKFTKHDNDAIVEVVSHSTRRHRALAVFVYFDIYSDSFKILLLELLLWKVFVTHSENQQIRRFITTIGNTFVIRLHGRIHNEFLEYQKIKFTMEIKEQNQLLFLNVLVIKNEGDILGYTVYWKPIEPLFKSRFTLLIYRIAIS